MYKKKGFTTGEVAELCHVTIPTVIKWIESEELEGFKIPGSKNRRITRESLLKFMKKYKIPTNNLEKGKSKILFVDSHKEMQEIFSSILDQEKYEIRCVTKGFEAGVAKEFLPDLVVLEIALPDIDGIKVCEYIREMPEMENVSILGISEQEGKLEELLEKGFDDYIQKPFDQDALLDKIKKLLNKTSRRKKNK